MERFLRNLMEWMFRYGHTAMAFDQINLVMNYIEKGHGDERDHDSLINLYDGVALMTEDEKRSALDLLMGIAYDIEAGEYKPATRMEG